MSIRPAFAGDTGEHATLGFEITSQMPAVGRARVIDLFNRRASQPQAAGDTAAKVDAEKVRRRLRWIAEVCGYLACVFGVALAVSIAFVAGGWVPRTGVMTGLLAGLLATGAPKVAFVAGGWVVEQVNAKVDARFDELSTRTAVNREALLELAGGLARRSELDLQIIGELRAYQTEMGKMAHEIRDGQVDVQDTLRCALREAYWGGYRRCAEDMGEVIPFPTPDSTAPPA